ncbi:uncharacterized protein LOC142775815 [Rhipicephalus microplus]|uniref:uncharacterized protein LOC142775815 n=1 Tax=Rhipicephalus microplus TaxID=6941 RepID=UPI003F6AB9CE
MLSELVSACSLVRRITRSTRHRYLFRGGFVSSSYALPGVAAHVERTTIMTASGISLSHACRQKSLTISVDVTKSAAPLLTTQKGDKWGQEAFDETYNQLGMMDMGLLC